MEKIDFELISSNSEYSAREIEDVYNNVGNGVSETQFAYFLGVCKEVKLSPLLKEVWCILNQEKGVIVVTGRDGFLSRAQENPAFSGIRSSEVCENDEYEADIPNGKIKHVIKGFGDRGKIIGGYAFVFRKDGEPTIETADFETYYCDSYYWDNYPADMIKKVPEARALKKACGLSGVQSEYEIGVKNGVAVPISENGSSDYSYDALQLITAYTGDDKESFRRTCIQDHKDGSIDAEYVENLRSKLNGN